MYIPQTWALHIVLSKEAKVSPDEIETQLCNYLDTFLDMDAHDTAEATCPTVDQKEPEPSHRRQGDKDLMFLWVG